MFVPVLTWLALSLMGADLPHSLWAAGSNAELFCAEATATGPDPRGLGLSPTAYAWLGGLLGHAQGLCALTNPTVNRCGRRGGETCLPLC